MVTRFVHGSRELRFSEQSNRDRLIILSTCSAPLLNYCSSHRTTCRCTFLEPSESSASAQQTFAAWQWTQTGRRPDTDRTQTRHTLKRVCFGLRLGDAHDDWWLVLESKTDPGQCVSGFASSPRSIRVLWIPARSSATYMYLFFLIRKLNSPKVELKFMKYTLHYITLPHSIYLWPWFWRSTVNVTWFIPFFETPPTSEMLKSTPRSTLHHNYKSCYEWKSWRRFDLTFQDHPSRSRYLF